MSLRLTEFKSVQDISERFGRSVKYYGIQQISKISAITNSHLQPQKFGIYSHHFDNIKILKMLRSRNIQYNINTNKGVLRKIKN